jgi:hypothetical protein
LKRLSPATRFWQRGIVSFQTSFHLRHKNLIMVVNSWMSPTDIED